MGLFDDAEVIYAYTRKQALEDGVLIDVSDTASRLGFLKPTVITAALLATINEIDDDEPVSRRAQTAIRLVCVLRGCRQACEEAGDDAGLDLFFDIDVPGFSKIWLNLGPDDEGKPVFTIGYPSDR